MGGDYEEKGRCQRIGKTGCWACMCRQAIKAPCMLQGEVWVYMSSGEFWWTLCQGTLVPPYPLQLLQLLYRLPSPRVHPGIPSCRAVPTPVRPLPRVLGARLKIQLKIHQNVMRIHQSVMRSVPNYNALNSPTLADVVHNDNCCACNHHCCLPSFLSPFHPPTDTYTHTRNGLMSTSTWSEHKSLAKWLNFAAKHANNWLEQMGLVPVQEEGVDHDIDQQAGQHIVGVEGQQGGAGNSSQGARGVLPGLQLLIAGLVLGHMCSDVLQPLPVGACPRHCEVPPATKC